MHGGAEGERVVAVIAVVVDGCAVVVVGVGNVRVVVAVLCVAFCCRFVLTLPYFAAASRAVAVAVVVAWRLDLGADGRRTPRDGGAADRTQWLVSRGVVEVLPEASRVEEMPALEPGPREGGASVRVRLS